MPKVVIAAVSGWAAGGGHSLNVVCDLSVASIEHARFKQTDANVGSFDAGYGSALLARQVGDKRAREIFFLARTYDAEHLHTIHAALFSPIYEWAGVPRTYPLNKDGLPFADPNQISRYLNHARDHIAAVDWTDLDHGGFAVEAGVLVSGVAHPRGGVALHQRL